MSEFAAPFSVQFYNDSTSSTNTFTIHPEQQAGRFPRYGVQLGPGQWTILVDWPGFEGVGIAGNYASTSGWHSLPIQDIYVGLPPDRQTKQVMGKVSVNAGDNLVIRLWRHGNVTEPHVTGSVVCIPTPPINRT